MPDIASVFKSEISRVARKEVRSDTQTLKKASATHRSEIAALKRRVLSLEAQLRQLARLVSRQLQTPTRLAAVVPEAAPAAESGDKIAFSAAGFAAQRQRLGLSAVQMASLLGVSDQSVRKWEGGKAHPRASQLSAIGAVRKMSRKDANQALAAPQPVG